MPISLYKRQRSVSYLLATLNYDSSNIALMLERVGKATGLNIDYYGDTVLYLAHLEALKSASQDLANKKHPEITAFYNVLTGILNQGIESGVSYVFVGD